MNLLTPRIISIYLITLIIVGVFAIPTNTNAAWNDIFKSNNSYNSGYDYNSTSAQSDGDIKISKEVKEIGVDDSYHDKIEVFPSALVEVWIEIKNTSSKYNAEVVATDEIGGNMVAVQNSLRVNGQPSQPGLTSGGLRFTIPSGGKTVITYRMHVCGNSGYVMRAYAYASGVGAATDGIIITTENFNVGFNNQTNNCYSQFQNTNPTTYNGSNSYSQSYSPFGEWTGVRDGADINTNPFGDWSGVNDSPTINSSPFGDWTGVSDSPSIDTSPFGDWRGSTSTAGSGSSFGDWNGSTVNSNNGGPFGDWRGSTSSNGTNNAFGEWTGVDNSGNQYNASGYSVNSTSESSRVDFVPMNSANSTSRIAYADNTNDSQTYATNFVAPTTGVEKSSPFIFASLLTLGFLVFKKRKLLFN